MDPYTPVNIAGAPYNTSSANSANSTSLSFLDQRYLDVSGADSMLSSLNAGNNNIINVLDPVNPQDGATKNYVDTSLNTTVLTAYFPVLTSDTSNSGGWIVSASSEYSSAYAAYKVTTTNDWATLGIISNYWVQIQAPSSVPAVIPVQIGVKGRLSNEEAATWKFDASNDGINYTTLLTSNTTITSASTLTFTVPSTGVSFRYFRIYAFTSSPGAINPGLSVFQVYYNALSGPKYLAVNGSNSMTGNLNMNTLLINNVGTPLVATDAANKQYVDTSTKQTVGVFPQ